MTLQEMSVEYRAQAQVLQGRIEALKQTQDTLDHGAARDQMALRIQTLQTIWRETRSLRWTALAVALPLAVGVALCGAVHLLSGLLPL